MTLTLSSRLPVPARMVWRDMTRMETINAEMWPWLSMGSPPAFPSLDAVAWRPGEPLFRSPLKLFTVLPVGVSWLTLARLDSGKGFVEVSPMTGMTQWRHERWLEPDGDGCWLHDRLAFSPRWSPRLSRSMVRLFFWHRHRRLRRRYRQAL